MTEALKKVPPVSTKYEALQYPDRPSTSAIEQDLNKPIEYFNLFFTPEQRHTFGINTSENARRKRAEQEQSQDTSDSDDDNDTKTPRAWRSIEGEAIGIFIGVLLLMGLTRNPRTETYWSKHTDTGRSPEITAVRPFRRKNKGLLLRNIGYFSQMLATNQEILSYLQPCKRSSQKHQE